MTDNKVYIVLGEQGSGKTTFLENLVNELSKSGVNVGGFIAEGIWSNRKRTGFILTTLKENRKLELSTIANKDDYISFGRFRFNPNAIRLGNEVINTDALKADIMVIDEIGIFELEEKVWFKSFRQLLANTSKPVIIAVREKIVDEVVDKFGLKNMTIFSPDDKPIICSKTILQYLESDKVK